MRPITEMPPEIAAGIGTVFCDIDDTLTTEGRLTAEAYQALEDLDRAGITVAPITGRPAGWCDMIARFWPVKGVVGENGAFYYAYDSQTKKMIRKLHPSVEKQIERIDRFEVIKARIKAEVPGASLSNDQPFRLADLAVDFCEDVEPLSQKEVSQIARIFEDEGATAKVSSIHVNGWFGNYDKLTTTKSLAEDILGQDITADNSKVVFVGDSPNDSPMFEFFANSCGVANVRAFENSIATLPRWISDLPCGSGFCQIANVILDAKKNI